MTASLFFSRLASRPGMLLAAALLWLAASAGALAQTTSTIQQVTVNGGTSTVNVTPPVNLTVAVTFVAGQEYWSKISFIFTPAGGGSSFAYCVFNSNYPLNTATRTRTYSIAAPTGIDLYTLTVATHTHSACKIPTPGGQLRGTTFTFAGGINTKPVIVGVDHLQFEHDGIGRTCGPKTVTIKACADLACNTVYTLATSVALDPDRGGTWGPVPSFTGGTTTAVLTKTTEGAMTLSGRITSPTPKSATTCSKSGVLGSCEVFFSTTSCRVDAVEGGKPQGTPIYTKTTAGFSLDVVTLNSSGVPVNTSGSVTAELVDEAGCAGSSPTSLSPAVSRIFSGTSRLSYTFAPFAASRNARVRITNGSLIGCSTDKFAIRPTSFAVTSTGTVTGVAATNASEVATPILKAGTTAFTLTATSSAGYDGVPKVNNNRLSAADVDVAGSGSEGKFVGTFGAGIGAGTGAGTASGSFTYSEVGYVKLLPYAVYDDGTFALVDKAAGECRTDVGLTGNANLGDPNLPDASGLIACYFGSAETANLGRFVPDHFVLSAASMKERAALTSCSAPGFSYMGEAMKANVVLAAVEGGGDQTSNYSGKFNRFTGPQTQVGINALHDAPGARVAFPACGPTKAHPCIETGVPDLIDMPDPQADAPNPGFVDGAADFSFPLTVFRPSGRVGPYDNLKVGLAPIDLDGVRLDPGTYTIDTVTAPGAAGASNHVLLGTTMARYGRMNVDNAYGSELLNLSLRVSAQYWYDSGDPTKPKGYVTNQLDSCTELPTADFTLAVAGYRGAIDATNMGQSHVVGGAKLVNGVGRVMLSKPTPAPTANGSAVLNSIKAYLPGSGRATFGVYKAGPVIYVRETY